MTSPIAQRTPQTLQSTIAGDGGYDAARPAFALTADQRLEAVT
jgi:hypothetical protein